MIVLLLSFEDLCLLFGAVLELRIRIRSIVFCNPSSKSLDMYSSDVYLTSVDEKLLLRVYFLCIF